MRKKKMKKMFMEIMDERFQDYRGIELWQKVINTENDLATFKAKFDEFTPVVNAIIGNPKYNNLAR
ncbi:hypothetical protein LCGC14_1790000 [marine sediment metagenome]|uniref:Uncharacterized protein n=1 Tax=marine sediment metagenome TaxID=412755 RepID=A0A0F9J7P3_9ZZZZ